MKNIITTILFITTIFISSCNFNSGGQSISVQRTANVYTFRATYPTHKTTSVINYIEKTLANDTLFTNTEYKNAEINLDNNLQFHVLAEPGYIEITFLKNKNSETGYRKLEKLCMGIKQELN